MQLDPFYVAAVQGRFGLLAFRGVDPVPTWGGGSSAGPDLIGTCFFLPAITCLIVTPIVRRHARGGVVERIGAPEALPAWLRPFRRTVAARAFLFGIAGLAVVGSLLAAGLVAAGPAHFELTPFLWIKASFSAVLGGLITPLIGLVALADADPALQAA